MAEIVGRDDQIGTIEKLLDHAIAGRGAALVLRGEAGIGKSVLLDHTVATGHERGVRVLSVTGVQAEVQIPYAGLDHLLRPLRPAPTAAGSPYRLAVEVLELLGEQDEPVLLAIEDAQRCSRGSWC